MKILLFITGYDQVHDYLFFQRFLKKLPLNDMCDIFIYCNKPDISEEIQTYFKEFNQKNKSLFITSKNAGYRVGGVEAVCVGMDMGIFQEYDYVIHLHPDVFMTDDVYLREILLENEKNDTVFFITKVLPDPRHFAFDFFIFKPKLLTVNIFKEELYSFTTSPEYYLHDMIQKYQVKYTMVKRFYNDIGLTRRIDDHLKLFHCHNLSEAELIWINI